MKKQNLLAIWFLTSIFLLVTHLGKGADVKEISPITDKILMIHFNDGHIDYTGLGESNFRDFVMDYESLNISNAINKANYTIKSDDDNNFGSAGKNPVNLGRKSKMSDVGSMFDDRPDYLSSHFIYIELPNAMVPGKTYTISMNNLASSSNEWTFVYDPMNMRSETIHVNQVGYRNNAKKYAYLSQYMGSFNAGTHTNGGLNLDSYSSTIFRVVKADDGTQVYSGTMSLQKSKTAKDSESGYFGPNKNFTNADVWQCDFSSVTTPGYYKIVVDRMGSSYPFEIEDDVYRDPLYTALRSMFFQRAGVYKELDEYDNMVYPASHVNNKMYFRDAGRGEYQEPTDLSKEVTGIWGWYFDAGDWDGIMPTHSKVPALMLMVYDMNPSKFRDGDVGNRWKRNLSDPWIDEGTNGIPDILDEAKWLIDYMKRARERLQSHGYGTGGVPHYVGVDAGAIGGKSSWTDDRNLNITRQDAGVTAMHAGLAGWLSACLDKAGRPQSEVDYYKNEAISAYNWAKSNGNLSDATFKREFRFGAAGLYRATGSASYQTDYINNYGIDNWEYWAGPEYDQMAACLYAMLPDGFPNLNTSHRTTVRNAIKSAADNWVNSGLTRGFRASHMTPNQWNFLGIFGTPRTMMQAVTYHFSGEQKYLDATQFSADYCLGGNPMNMVWMSGVGHYFDEQPFHPDSWYLIDFDHKAYDNPILPGYVTYGTHYDCDFFGCGWEWEGDEDFSRSSAFPECTNAGLFPQSEARFPNRVNIPGSEYTIHQNQLHAIFTYGYLSSSSPASFTPNARPTVSLQLSDNQQVPNNANLQLEVNASSDTRKVDYYYDWQLIGTSRDKNNGFLLNWDVSKYKVNVGQDYLITAKAYDDKGLISVPTSGGEKTIQIVTGSSNNPPTVSITSPSNGAEYTAPASINISANASDSDGSISKVEFYQGSVKIGEKTSSPYTYTWNDVEAGSYVLTAKAFDNSNAVTTSAGVNVTVTGESTDCTFYEAETNYTGSSVTVTTGNSGYTGSGYIDYGGQNSYAEWNISVASAGSYTFRLRYANGSSGNRQCEFRVNSSAKGNVSFAPTGNWATWNVVEFTTNLNSGNNAIRIVANTSAGGPNLDNYEVCGGQIVETFTLTTSSPNGSISRDPDQSAYESGSVVTLTAVPNSGYTFSHWSGDTDVNVNPVDITMNSDKNITANFSQISTPDNLISNEEFNDGTTGWTAQFHNGAAGSFAVVTNAGMSGSNAGKVTITDGGTANWNAELYSLFNLESGKTYEISFQAKSETNRSILVVLQKNSSGYEHYWEQGVNITTTSSTYGPYTWTSDVTDGSTRMNFKVGANASDVWVDNVIIREAGTSTTYTLTLNSPNGSVSKNPDKTAYNENEQVALTANPDSGYEFDYWSGDASGSNNPLTISMDANKNITANFTQSPTGCTGTGSISYLRYHDITGTAVSNLTSAAKYPNSPDFTTTYTSFEGPTNVMDNYGVLMRGYICPPTSGSYTFWIAGDDNVELWISTNDSPANKSRIAYHSAWTNSKEWNKYATQKSAAISLTAGQTYYVEALMKEGGGGDNIAVGWAKPGQATTAPSEVIPGSSLIPYADTPAVTYTLNLSATNGSITKSPDKASYTSGELVTLTATANSGYIFTGWSGDASGSTNPLEITMDANKDITANFAVQTVPDCTLANPSFESDLQNWTINSGTIDISSNATDGEKSARLYGSDSGMEQGYVKTVAQGTEVTLNFDAFIAGSVGWAGVGLDFKAADNSDILKETIQITNTAWQSRTIVANAPAGAERLVVWAYTSSGELFVDNFCISGSALKMGSGVTSKPERDDLKISLYPNPSVNGFVYLLLENYNETEDLAINVFDTSGRKVFNQNVEINGGSVHTIDCREFEKGIYFFNIQDRVKSRTIKIVLN